MLLSICNSYLFDASLLTKKHDNNGPCIENYRYYNIYSMHFMGIIGKMHYGKF